ncbi:MAG: G-D-S-L family lipolytic protein [Chitinophagaceae bacterium]|nr:G-D-S-L family lipolytic protein [Chitinophagaceae bacterium]
MRTVFQKKQKSKKLSKLFLKAVIILWFAFAYTTAPAQPFASEIAAFKKQDSISFPPAKAILFVGSSSFRMWKDMPGYFPGYTIINRGFGGSAFPDVIRYAGDIILPYRPKQIVIYCGENDFAGNDTLSPAQVTRRFMELFTIIRSRYKKVPIAYVSMKPSPSRTKLLAKFEAANEMIKNFLATKKRTAYIDVYHAMLQQDGTPDPDIFLDDKLHMNAKGYAIWQKIIKPNLIKN